MGLRVKGTGVGQRVKGKRWERMQKGLLERRRLAMLRMPGLVRIWKQVSFLCGGVRGVWGGMLMGGCSLGMGEGGSGGRGVGGSFGRRKV